MLAGLTENGERVETDKEILELLEKKLLKENQNKPSLQENTDTLLSDKLFLFSVRNVNDSLKRKKVLESIETLESQSISVVYDEKEIPPGFDRLPRSTESLALLYKNTFDSLKDICRKFVPSDSESSGEERERERISQSAAPSDSGRATVLAVKAHLA